MRLSLIPALVAGATIVAASPIQVEVITIDQVSGPVPSPFRFGHAAHQGNNELLGAMMKSGAPMPQRGGKGRKPCTGMGRSRSAFRTKALEISNAFRKAIGLPVIVVEAHPHYSEVVFKDAQLRGGEKKVEEQEFHILPFMPGPPIEPVPNTNNEVTNLPHPRPYRPYHHHSHGSHHIHRLDKAPFVDRLLISIGMLGKWEGRAVAFVFGAGLGVLLRMFYVLTVVAFRTFKRPSRPTEEEHEYVIFVEELEQEAEPTLPAYTKDEKVPLPAEN